MVKGITDLILPTAFFISLRLDSLFGPFVSCAVLRPRRPEVRAACIHRGTVATGHALSQWTSRNADPQGQSFELIHEGVVLVELTCSPSRVRET
jgi:hypothetical protein